MEIYNKIAIALIIFFLSSCFNYTSTERNDKSEKTEMALLSIIKDSSINLLQDTIDMKQLRAEIDLLHSNIDKEIDSINSKMVSDPYNSGLHYYKGQLEKNKILLNEMDSAYNRIKERDKKIYEIMNDTIKIN